MTIRPEASENSRPRVLTASLLQELEVALSRHAPGLLDSVAPGLPASRIDELTAPLGLRLPSEARALWSWHDGVAEIIFGWPHVPLASVVKQCRRCPALARDASEDLGRDMPEYDDPELWWRDEWFQVFEPGGTLVTAVDCKRA